MPKLNDIQTILLSTASRRGDGSLYPLPDSLAAGGAAISKAIVVLAKAGLIDKRADDAAFVTPAGLEAIGISEAAEPAEAAAAPLGQPKARVTKADVVVDLLKREGGAGLAELITATGWLPHTTRAALTGFRKKGHAVERFKRDDATRYRIAG